MKKCSRCKAQKDESMFTKNRRSKDGLWCYCKECVSLMGKEERAKDPEKFKQKSKKYREDNPEKFKESQRKTYEKHRERKKNEQREYYWKNHEEVKKRANERNKTIERKETRKKYYKENKEWLSKQKEAHMIVQYAIKLGVLKKSLYCEECGSTECLIDGHHENYDEPIKVKWVCRKCHRKLEKRGN